MRSSESFEGANVEAILSVQRRRTQTQKEGAP
jgi:hypothetical protein